METVMQVLKEGGLLFLTVPIGTLVPIVWYMVWCHYLPSYHYHKCRPRCVGVEPAPSLWNNKVTSLTAWLAPNGGHWLG